MYATAKCISSENNQFTFLIHPIRSARSSVGLTAPLWQSPCEGSVTEISVHDQPPSLIATSPALLRSMCPYTPQTLTGGAEGSYTYSTRGLPSATTWAYALSRFKSNRSDRTTSPQRNLTFIKHYPPFE